MSSDLVPQTEVESIQLNECKGLHGGLLFEFLLLAFGGQAGPGHHITQGTVGGGTLKTALQVGGTAGKLGCDHRDRRRVKLLGCMGEGEIRAGITCKDLFVYFCMVLMFLGIFGVGVV